MRTLELPQKGQGCSLVFIHNLQIRATILCSTCCADVHTTTLPLSPISEFRFMSTSRASYYYFSQIHSLPPSIRHDVFIHPALVSLPPRLSQSSVSFIVAYRSHNNGIPTTHTMPISFIPHLLLPTKSFLRPVVPPKSYSR
jgi:hypothetical protein